MAMKLTFTNIMKFFSYIAPLLLGTCLVLISFFNSDAKGIIYLAGALLTRAFKCLFGRSSAYTVSYTSIIKV